MESKYAHIYNRGVDKRNIFTSDKDRLRFLEAARLARLKNSPRLSVFLKQVQTGLISPSKIVQLDNLYGPCIAEVLAYVLMPNHFHFLIRETADDGIPKFAQRLGNSYTRYFNLKHDRKGRLFESSYQQVRVKSDEQLIHLGRYIHLNPLVSKRLHLTLNELKNYPWSSLPSYLENTSEMCNLQEIMSHFESPDRYWQFVKAEADPTSQLPKNLLFD